MVKLDRTRATAPSAVVLFFLFFITTSAISAIEAPMDIKAPVISTIFRNGALN